MKLVIVESPKKCATIAKYLGSEFKVMASGGHIRDLATRGKGKLGIEIDNGFKPIWEVYPKSRKTIDEIKAIAAKAEEVYLATDPDREGEAISWHLAQVLNLKVTDTPRLQFHEITRPAIEAAIENPTLVNMNLVLAQEARRMEDRIIGFKLSSLMQKNYHINSAGRVQSATLGMIVDRQKTIDAFVPEEYWVIEVSIEIEGKTYKMALKKIDGKPFGCKTKEEAEAIVARMPKELHVDSVSKKTVSISPKPPFTTSALQQEAYNKFKFSNKMTQDLAQKLYEGKIVNGEHVGLITYIRTDSTRISPEFYNRHSKPYIIETYGEEYVGPFRQPKKGKNEQDAHEAIRPTGTHRTPDLVANDLTSSEAKLYRLIYCRALASLMAPKVVERTSVSLSGNGMEFSLTGSRTLFKGYSVIYEDSDDQEANSLPNIEKGASFGLVSIDPQQKFTSPEAPYNEASIVKAMEEQGIGRPSTYAATIDKLLKNKYVIATKGVLTPTNEGIIATGALQKYFPSIVSTSYTASMERELDLVEAGEQTLLKTMQDFYEPFMETFDKAKVQIKEDGPAETPNETCPVCGKPLMYRYSRVGGDRFIGCSGWPSCTYRKSEVVKPVEDSGIICPQCGEGHMMVRVVAKKGKKSGTKFLGCSNFPKCKCTMSLDKDGKPVTAAPQAPKAEAVKTDITCPKCKKGHLVIRDGKKGKFYACSTFPRCRFTKNYEENPAAADKE